MVESRVNHREVVRAIFHSSAPSALWYAESIALLDLPTNFWLWDTPPRRINLLGVYPTYIPKIMTLAKWNDPVYHKKIDLLRYANQLFGKSAVKDITSREIRQCESLRRHPHPNICHYHGVTVDKTGLEVSGLIFDRYDSTLQDMVRHGASFDAAQCLQHLKATTEHLHSLGLVRCDIKPNNIFVEYSPKHYVLGDLDSAHHEGTILNIKAGTPGWVPGSEETLEFAIKDID
jgi:serine/threonine protein kinase